MRVLHINKFAWDKGGAEIYMQSLANKQAEIGSQVAVMGSSPKASLYHPDIALFDVEVPDFHAASSPKSKVAAASNVLWSRSARQRLDETLDSFSPDIVHIHNYAHQLTSSILDLLEKRSLPVVHTAHDYKLICPAYIATRKEVDCFNCAHRISPRLLTDRCHQGSMSWSSTALVESVFVRKQGYAPKHIIAPSVFMADHLRDSWLAPESTIHYVPNPAPACSQAWVHSEGYLLYVGRLSREKGIADLIEACAALSLRLEIAGEGPLRPELQRLASARRASVTFHGHVGPEKLANLRAFCQAQVVPSAWPENAPLSVLEAAASGTPLILADRGGLSEYITHGARAVLINKFDQAALRNALTELDITHGDPSRFNSLLSWEAHLKHIDTVYTIARVQH